MRRIDPKEAFHLLKPERIVFVVSVDKARRPSGMVAAWHMKCSFSPPLLAVSLSKQSNTRKLVLQSREFVVAVPNKRLERAVQYFGSTSGDEVDKFAATRVRTSRARMVHSPLLRDATFNFECKLLRTVPAGDHTLLIGKVLAAYATKKKVLFSVSNVRGKRIFREF
ncbi:MAG: flavin reductase family protein [Nanoarchaeota archaeon]